MSDETERLLRNESRDPSRAQQRLDDGDGNEHSRWIRWCLHTGRRVLHSNKVYALLVFVPLGIASGTFGGHPIATLLFNLLAIIPLSALVSYSADELSEIVGELLGGLINATLGNAVELAVGVLALVQGDLHVVQSVMLGSILSDLLLVLGCCLFSAALDKQTPTFNPAMADALSSLMIITATALILPTALYSTFSESQRNEFASRILTFSRVSAVVLLALYVMFVYYELSHPQYFNSDPSQPNSAVEDARSSNRQQEVSLDVSAASALLLVSTAGIVICAHLLLDSVEGTAETAHITKTFIAAILIPIASNAPEAATIMAVSRGNKVNYGIGVIVGSIVQIALFVIPFLVILGWILHQGLNLYFETFQTIMLFLSVLVVNRLLQDRMYTYVQGAMLVALYTIIATVFFLRPESDSVTVFKIML